MKKVEFSAEVFVYDDLNELQDIEVVLLEKAQEALEKAYAPYSNFLVGSAVLLENGEILSGANQENAAYSSCICAERTVLSAASSMYPNVKPIMISVVIKNLKKDTTDPAAPCGECRQYIFEVESRFQSAIPILMKAQSNKIYKVNSASQLLPLAFTKSDLL
jgi:cytidine deaminase